MRLALAAFGVVAILVALLSWSENRRLRVALGSARSGAADAARTEEALRADVRRLEHELASALETRESVVEIIERHRQELDAARAEAEAKRRRATRAPPEGVRLALLGLNERLAADGFGNLRFLYAARIEDRALHEVEFIEHLPDRFSTSVWSAGRVELELDRSTGVLVMRCFDGEVIAAGGSRAFPDDGEPLSLDSVDGEAWEARLPFLVRAHGRYPRPEDDPEARTAIDPATASIWVERLDRLLEAAGTDLRLRVARIRDLREARFGDVLLHAYDDGKVLTQSMSARSLEVRVDAVGGTVELLLRDGVLLQRGGETPIPASGYRILLPEVGVARARELMLGMVVDA